MIRRLFIAAMCVCAFAAFSQTETVQAQQPMPQAMQQPAYQPAYGATWGQQGARNMDRFYHYPYVTYPQNYWGNDYYRSADSLYHRYPAEMRIPVYNRQWQNYYPTPRRYHWGHQFITDVF
jgi:hypothetical protein